MHLPRAFSSAAADAAGLVDTTKQMKPNANPARTPLTASLSPAAASLLTAATSAAAAAAPDAQTPSAPASPQSFPFGVLAGLPLLPPPAELLSIARARSARLQRAKAVSGAKGKARDLAVRRLHTEVTYLLYRIDRCLAAAPARVAALHPYERTAVGLALGSNAAPALAPAQHSGNSNSHNSADEADASVPDDDTQQQQQQSPSIFSAHAAAGERAYHSVLAELRRVRNRVHAVHQHYTALLSSPARVQSLADVTAAAAAAAAALDAAVCGPESARALGRVRDTFSTLRRLNIVNPRLPTVALVGAPNVGKSSLVRLLSTAKPEVQNYPFTTRAVSVGHLTLRANLGAAGTGAAGERGARSVNVKVQVTDTPGLLNRPDSERKAMEMFTLAVLEHVPALVVCFVLDPSGHCGTSLADQLLIRQELRWRYHKLVPGTRWFDVATKTDIWKAGTDANGESGDSEHNAAMVRDYENGFYDNGSTRSAAGKSATTGTVRAAGSLPRKATTTATPSAPSSLSVMPDWSLAEAIAALPPRPVGFVDDDCHSFEVTVAGVASVASSSDSNNVNGSSSSGGRGSAPGASSAGPVVGPGPAAAAAAAWGQRGLAEMQGALAWELSELCNDMFTASLSGSGNAYSDAHNANVESNDNDDADADGSADGGASRNSAIGGVNGGLSRGMWGWAEVEAEDADDTLQFAMARGYVRKTKSSSGGGNSKNVKQNKSTSTKANTHVDAVDSALYDMDSDLAQQYNNAGIEDGTDRDDALRSDIDALQTGDEALVSDVELSPSENEGLLSEDEEAFRREQRAAEVEWDELFAAAEAGAEAEAAAVAAEAEAKVAAKAEAKAEVATKMVKTESESKNKNQHENKK